MVWFASVLQNPVHSTSPIPQRVTCQILLYYSAYSSSPDGSGKESGTDQGLKRSMSRSSRLPFATRNVSCIVWRRGLDPLPDNRPAFLLSTDSSERFSYQIASDCEVSRRPSDPANCPRHSIKRRFIFGLELIPTDRDVRCNGPGSTVPPKAFLGCESHVHGSQHG